MFNSTDDCNIRLLHEFLIHKKKEIFPCNFVNYSYYRYTNIFYTFLNNNKV